MTDKGKTPEKKVESVVKNKVESKTPFLNNDQNDADVKPTSPAPIFGATWYILLAMYMALFAFTGHITFFTNNEYSTSPENMVKFRTTFETPRQFQLFEDLITSESSNFEGVNELASQSFNVVLGALLGFLATTATLLRSEESKDDDS